MSDLHAWREDGGRTAAIVLCDGEDITVAGSRGVVRAGRVADSSGATAKVAATVSAASGSGSTAVAAIDPPEPRSA